MPKTNYEISDPRLLTGFLVLLFAVAPLYYQPNWGGRGLELPFNFATWAVAVLLIACITIIVTLRKTLYLPRGFLFFISIPVIIFLNGLIMGASQPAAFLFREMYIWGGLLYFFALFQFRLKPGQVDWILLLIVLTTIIHSALGVLQIFFTDVIGNWYATSDDGAPRGVFQQRNAQATFLVTVLAMAMYLLSRPIAGRFSYWVSGLVILSVAINSFVIVYSGSRVGLLASVALLLILVIFRRRQFLNNKILVVLAFVALTSGALLGQGGFEDRAADRPVSLEEGSRLTMYSIALELVAQKPLQGHGIGNFLRVWNLQSGDYFARNPEAILPTYLDHPHNELVFWMIEGGLIIVSGILATIFYVFYCIFRCGLQRGAGYTAMLLPITLHAQVEQPFYLSSVHWFLWLFLLFMVMRHRVIKLNVIVSDAATRLIQATSLVASLGVLYFLLSTARAQVDITAYLSQAAKPPYLQVALDNLYFRFYAEELAMRSRLYQGINTENSEQVRQYLEWSAERAAIHPKLKLFEDMINAYVYLEDDVSRCNVIDTAIRMYPQNRVLRDFRQDCAS